MNVTIPLRQQAKRSGVPAYWLRREALAGRIPCLLAGAKILFHPPTVERVLAERASGEAARA